MRHKNVTAFLALMLAVILILFALVLLASPAHAAEPEPIRTARQEDLHTDANNLRAMGYTEDSPEIKALQAAWWAEQEALDIVARVVQGEAGSCPWMHQLAVAAVVVNRVNDPRFPGTAREVVSAPRQYTLEYLTGFENTSQQCYLAAKKALDGMTGVPEDIVWQAEFVQGREIWWISEVNTGWYASTTYFCR